MAVDTRHSAGTKSSRRRRTRRSSSLLLRVLSDRCYSVVGLSKAAFDTHVASEDGWIVVAGEPARCDDRCATETLGGDDAVAVCDLEELGCARDEEEVAFNDCCCDVGEFATVVLGVVAQ